MCFGPQYHPVVREKGLPSDVHSKKHENGRLGRCIYKFTKSFQEETRYSNSDFISRQAWFEKGFKKHFQGWGKTGVKWGI